MRLAPESAPRYRWVEALGAWRNTAWDKPIDSSPLVAMHRALYPFFLWPKAYR